MGSPQAEPGDRRILSRARRTDQPPAHLYDEEYFLSRACDGLSEYLSGGLSPVRRREVERLGVTTGQVVLDLGCGRGESSREISRIGASVISMDYSADAVSLTRGLIGPAAAVVQADAAALPFRDGVIDRVLLGDVIEHLPWGGGVAALREVSRVMVPGGRALVHTSPNTWFIRFVKPPLVLRLRLLRWEDTRHRFAEYDRLRQAMHPNELNPVTLPRLLAAAGLRGETWVDPDVLRSGDSEWTAALGRSRLYRMVAAIAGTWPIRLLLGNDLYAVFQKG
jgi:SAM-dependent methyltransferase